MSSDTTADTHRIPAWYDQPTESTSDDATASQWAQAMRRNLIRFQSARLHDASGMSRADAPAHVRHAFLDTAASVSPDTMNVLATVVAATPYRAAIAAARQTYLAADLPAPASLSAPVYLAALADLVSALTGSDRPRAAITADILRTETD